MKQSDSAPASCVSPLPAGLLLRLAGLPELFTRPTWCNALLLLTGAILAPGKRTVTAALRILGREQETDFPIYHGVLNRAVWSSRAVAGWLLRLLVASLLGADATVVIGIDDTIERRWGHKISARGIYRDPVRSSKGHFVKACPRESGDQWPALVIRTTAGPHSMGWTHHGPALSHHACAVQALLCRRTARAQDLAGLGPSGRFADPPLAARPPHRHRRRHGTCRHRVPRSRPRLSQCRHTITPRRQSFCPRTAQTPAPRTTADQEPAPAKAGGKRLAKLGQVLHDPGTVWQRHTVTLWYGRTNRIVELATGTAVWYHSGLPPVPIRWLLVRDPLGELRPQAFLSTDLDAAAVDILQWFVSRWQLEVTFQDARAHLGVETQRQWSDLAILRTTPALLGLFSLVTLWAHDLAAEAPLAPATAAWYPKLHCTFSDAIAAVRRQIWQHQSSCMSRRAADVIKIPRQLWQRAANALAYAA
jgi:hypothetical protein